MRILVTGSAGFIGFHLTRQLLTDGHEVVGVDVLNDYYDPLLKEKRNDILKATAEYEFHRSDIADHEAMDKLVAETKPEMIVHLAAQAGVRYSLVNP
jgi:UDP-glucuronate 4-epimerase